MKYESSELLRAELNDLRRMSTHLNESLKNSLRLENEGELSPVGSKESHPPSHLGTEGTGVQESGSQEPGHRLEETTEGAVLVWN